MLPWSSTIFLKMEISSINGEEPGSYTRGEAASARCPSLHVHIRTEHSGVCTTATALTMLAGYCPRTGRGRIPPKKSGKCMTWTLLLDFNPRSLQMLPPFPLLHYPCSSEPDRAPQSRDVLVWRFQAVAVCVPNSSPYCSARAERGHPTSHGDPPSGKGAVLRLGIAASTNQSLCNFTIRLLPAAELTHSPLQKFSLHSSNRGTAALGLAGW